MCGQLCDNQDELVAHTSNEHPQFSDVLLRKLEAKRVRYAKYAAKMNREDGDTARASVEKIVANNLEPELVTGDVSDQIHLQNGVPEEQNESVERSKKRPHESSPPVSNKKGRTGRRTYTCAKCDLVTKWPREFLSHRRDVHGDHISIHECPFCEYASKKLYFIKRHCNVVHKEEMYVENSRHLFKTASSASSPAPSAEINVNIQEKVFKCNSCNFIAKRKIHVEEHEKKGHLKRQSSDGEFHCSKCSFMTMSRKSLSAHCLQHHNEVLKDATSSEGENTEREIVDDDEDRLVIDEDAAEDSTSPPSLKMTLKQTEEIAVVENIEGTMWKCRYCPQQVLWPSELKRHEETHFKMNKKYGCLLCHIRFDQLNHLEHHVMLNHQEEPSDKSSSDAVATGKTSASIIIELGKSDDSTSHASYSGSTQAHDISIKSKQPIHVCQHCGYITRWISGLRKHELTHENLKPFKCAYCSYTSRWNSDLKRHAKKHNENTGAADTNPNEDPEHAKSSHVMHLLLEPKNADHDYDSKAAEPSLSKGSEAPSRKLLPKPAESQCSFEVPVGIPRIVQKYKCPQCSFLTRTASHFHTHMIQHLNKKPFMCSVCNYRSNWQFEVNKHIKGKSGNDAEHKKAELVVIDETGFKNYAKYKIHLVDVKESSKGDKVLQPAQPSRLNQEEVQLIRPDETENIVVTPDILYGDQDYQDDLGAPIPE
ncbi:hypothetical protein V5799_021572 [Amblyomma americanum]|uniref:C2H2-type domain-containing protein n=1 Tax=Amblyomma americanum TaxID=6943 RepID=A0AAQ4FQ83_AMBAM